MKVNKNSCSGYTKFASSLVEMASPEPGAGAELVLHIWEPSTCRYRVESVYETLSEEPTRRESAQ